MEKACVMEYYENETEISKPEAGQKNEPQSLPAEGQNGSRTSASDKTQSPRFATGRETGEAGIAAVRAGEPAILHLEWNE